MDIDKLINDKSIPNDLRLSLIEKQLAHQLSQQRLELETRKTRFNTPLAVALTGLITLSGNFLFDALRSEQETQESITLEEVKSTISDTLAESEALRIARAAERSFQYEIMQTELSRSADAEERAKALLFLTEAGLLDGLQVQKLRDWATGSLENLGIETESLDVPALKNITSLENFSNQSAASILAAIDERNLPGYNQSFLSVDLPLPIHPEAGRRLDFARFTIEMDSKRRYARIAAANVDGSQRISLERPDNFSSDPRLSDIEQLTNEFYRGSGFDRGHLVDTRSATWGEFVNGQIAIASIFLHPNLTPQSPHLNRRDWRKLESYISKKIEVNEMRASIFSGPIFTDEDPVHKGIKIPRAFWKIVVAERNGGIFEVGAFLVSQNAYLIELGLEHVPNEPVSIRTATTEFAAIDTQITQSVDPIALMEFVGYKIPLPATFSAF